MLVVVGYFEWSTSAVIEGIPSLLNGEFGESGVLAFDLVSTSLQQIKMGGREAAEYDRNFYYLRRILMAAAKRARRRDESKYFYFIHGQQISW